MFLAYSPLNRHSLGTFPYAFFVHFIILRPITSSPIGLVISSRDAQYVLGLRLPHSDVWFQLIISMYRNVSWCSASKSHWASHSPFHNLSIMIFAALNIRNHLPYTSSIRLRATLSSCFLGCASEELGRGRLQRLGNY
jgi:hypothetical protein